MYSYNKYNNELVSTVHVAKCSSTKYNSSSVSFCIVFFTVLSIMNILHHTISFLQLRSIFRMHSFNYMKIIQRMHNYSYICLICTLTFLHCTFIFFKTIIYATITCIWYNIINHFKKA